MKDKIQGTKIYLKPIQKEHIPLFAKWTNDPEINEFTTGRGFTLEEEKEWFEETVNNKNEHVFSIYLQEDDKVIGNCGLHGNYQLKEEFNGKTFLGIMIGEKDEWGKGYGTDVVFTLLKYAKEELKEKEICLSVSDINPRAIRLYEKCGFQKALHWHNPKRVNEHKEEYIMRVEL
jgi:RimJ/RimL family protein N-acetyltransferase